MIAAGGVFRFDPPPRGRHNLQAVNQAFVGGFYL